MHGAKVIIGISALWLSGCAVHPLPEDVTRESTYHIVQKIRCEAREALTQLSVLALRESNYPPTLELADRIETGDLADIKITDLFQNPHLRRLVDRQVHQNFEIFALSALAFAFTFNIKEDNDNSANASFQLPMVNGPFSLLANAGKKLNRESERKLEANHTFLELYRFTDRDVCRAIEAGGGHVIYPITGKIGLYEVFKTFYLLNRPHNPALKNPPDEGFQNHRMGRDVKDFTDELKFTTRFNIGTTPSITLAAVPDRFTLTSASATLSASREDLHRVLISLEVGDAVTSLAQAMGRVGGQSVRSGAQIAKVRASRRVKEIRTENFISTIRDDFRRRGVPID